MEDVLKADIFFFVATIAIVAITPLVVVAGYHVVRILREVERMVRIAREEEEKLAETIDVVSEHVEESAEALREGIEESVSTIEAYGRAAKRASGLGGIVSLLVSIVNGKHQQNRAIKRRKASKKHV